MKSYIKLILKHTWETLGIVTWFFSTMSMILVFSIIGIFIFEKDSVVPSFTINDLIPAFLHLSWIAYGITVFVYIVRMTLLPERYLPIGRKTLLGLPGKRG